MHRILLLLLIGPFAVSAQPYRRPDADLPQDPAREEFPYREQTDPRIRRVVSLWMNVRKEQRSFDTAAVYTYTRGLLSERIFYNQFHWDRYRPSYTTRYRYNEAGQMTARIDIRHQYEFCSDCDRRDFHAYYSYDQHGRMQTEVSYGILDGDTASRSFYYFSTDPNGRLLRITYPEERSGKRHEEQYAYRHGRLSLHRDFADSVDRSTYFEQRYRYDAGGRLRGIERFKTTAGEREYLGSSRYHYTRKRLTGAEHLHGDSVVRIERFDYNNGRLQHYVDSSRTFQSRTTFTYEAPGRIRKEVRTNNALAFRHLAGPGYGSHEESLLPVPGRFELESYYNEHGHLIERRRFAEQTLISLQRFHIEYNP